MTFCVRDGIISSVKRCFLFKHIEYGPKIQASAPGSEESHGPARIRRAVPFCNEAEAHVCEDGMRYLSSQENSSKYQKIIINTKTTLN